MKRGAAILLSLLIVSVSLKDLAIYFSFQLNRNYIARNLCVNLDSPEVMCYGKCFLDKELKNSNEKTGTYPMPDRQDRTVFIFNALKKPVNPTAKGVISLPSFHYRAFFPSPGLESVFHPPRIASLSIG
ncbi:MAG TPA: hypothetical protein PKE06_27190 [Flavilitoribacter sp.]|nr:hypothetical protein [Flavilitoribacter sp.]HMQ87729.1 hypothetical protein [Flavilitoribacter sp.]